MVSNTTSTQSSEHRTFHRTNALAMSSLSWMTSGAQRLKANLNRSFGARKNKKAAAHSKFSKDKSYESIVASARIGDARRSNGKLNHQVERLVRRSSHRPPK
mmetsp:Transcript_14842/g.26980  ORF Transcript_14842/g.26980 Transcript_14842/m.26980 type:complete len:102 (-) Transcript_14842:496-801(-)